MISAEERERILSAELTRPRFPGLRVVSPGILRHCRTLQLSEFTPGVQVDPAEDPAARAARELVAFAYLLDTRHTLDQLDIFVEAPLVVRVQLLREYEFGIPLTLIAGVKKELALTKRAMSAIDYDIEPKPDDPEPARPRGNS